MELYNVYKKEQRDKKFWKKIWNSLKKIVFVSEKIVKKTDKKILETIIVISNFFVCRSPLSPNFLGELVKKTYALGIIRFEINVQIWKLRAIHPIFWVNWWKKCMH